MYCRVCGNLLEENDLICKVCGADIREQQRRAAAEAEAALVGAEAAPSASDFASPRGDADKTSIFGKYEAIFSHGTAAAPTAGASGAGEPADGAAPARASSDDEFRWNVHNFPSAELRKTDDIDFDWSLPPSSVDPRTDLNAGAEAGADAARAGARETPEVFFENRENRAFAELIQDPGDAAGLDFAESFAYAGADAFFAREAEARSAGDIAAPARTAAESAADVFADAFGSDAGKSNRARFFTFDQKNEEFQKLLDREYERLQSYNSPIVDEAREMLAAWDMPAGTAGGRADFTSRRRPPAALREEFGREVVGGGAGAASKDTPPQGEAPLPRADAPQEAPQGENGPAAAPASAEPIAEAPGADASQTRGETILSIEELLREAAGRALPAAGAAPAPEFSFSAAAVLSAGRLAASDAGALPAAKPAGAMPEALDPETSAATEAEFSINKTLDSIEKEIEEWENRERLSTASKVAVVISLVFLLFTGGSALVKHLAPHSSLDLWFDSVQLQAAVTIKHGVDKVKALFDDTRADEAGGETGAADGAIQERES